MSDYVYRQKHETIQCATIIAGAVLVICSITGAFFAHNYTGLRGDIEYRRAAMGQGIACARQPQVVGSDVRTVWVCVRP